MPLCCYDASFFSFAWNYVIFVCVVDVVDVVDGDDDVDAAVVVVPKR